MNPDGAEKFKEIATAYDTIGDEAKRSQYDNRLNNPFGNTNGMSYEDLRYLIKLLMVFHYQNLQNHNLY